jgi:hypothetical protein
VSQKAALIRTSSDRNLLIDIDEMRVDEEVILSKPIPSPARSQSPRLSNCDVQGPDTECFQRFGNKVGFVRQREGTWLGTLVKDSLVFVDVREFVK